MKKLIYIALFATIVVSCKKQEGYKPIIYGVATPFQLTGDTTIFYSSDYVLDFKSPDSIVFPQNLKALQQNDSIYFVIKTGKVKPLSTIKIYRGGASESILVINREKQKVTIEYKGKEKFKSLKVIGSMNYWNRNNPGMQNVNGTWKEDFVLSPGTYEYLFYSEGKEFADPDNPARAGNNSVLQVGKYLPEELPFLTPKSYIGHEIEINSTQYLDGVYAFWQNIQIDAKINGDNIKISVPEQAASIQRSFIRVFAFNSNGISNDILIPLESGAVVDKTSELNRCDKQTMIMYFLMVDRFFDGDSSNDEKVDDPEILPKANFYGGDLKGVEDKLDAGYFTDLGVNTLWLSPIIKNPEGAWGLNKNPRTKFSGYHGYWPVSDIKIDHRFGTPAILHSIVGDAHKKNMNVLLDYVAHHVHIENPVYKMHPGWFTSLYLPDGTMNTQKWDEYRLTTWFDTFLPTLDLRKKVVVDAMVDSAVFWVKNYHIDGFRHDATKHIDELYWRTLTQKIKKLENGKPFYQIGETYGSPILISSYISSGMLNAQFDFNVYDNAIACFALDNENFGRLKTVLSQSWKYYGYNNLMGNISGNQDRARFISYASGDLSFNEDAKYAGWTRDIEVSDSSAYKKLAMLHAFNMTIPGIPVIYYGDEIGMPGGNDPDNRRQMQFNNLTLKQEELKNTVKKLISTRNSSMALLYGQTTILLANGRIFAYTRNYFDDNVLIVFNKSREDKDVSIDLPVNQSKLKAEFNSATKLENGKLIVSLKPLSFDIIHY